MNRNLLEETIMARDDKDRNGLGFKTFPTFPSFALISSFAIISL